MLPCKAANLDQMAQIFKSSIEISLHSSSVYQIKTMASTISTNEKLDIIKTIETGFQIQLPPLYRYFN